MADKSHIEWTDATWNPITGCSLVSEACRHCYAATLAATRLKNHPSRKGLARLNAAGEAKFTGELRFNEQWLDQPLRWKKPRRIFVCAHADLFHENVPDEWIDRIFAVMALAPQHTFQVLTKRPERMRDYMRGHRSSIPYLGRMPLERIHLEAAGHMEGDGGFMDTLKEHGNVYSLYLDAPWPLHNVWLGTSIEDQPTADTRIPYLLATPAAIRFVSAEPRLGPVDLRRWMNDWGCEACGYGGDATKDHCPNCGWVGEADSEFSPCPECGQDLSDYYACPQCDATNDQGFGPTLSGYTLGYLDWIIVGGESGRKARPMHPDWARQIRDQCEAAGVPFLFKQWGGWRPKLNFRDGLDAGIARGCVLRPNGAVASENEIVDTIFTGHMPHGTHMLQVGKKRAGRLLDGIEHNGFPELQP